MRNIIKYCIALVTGLCLLVACKKEGSNYELKTVPFEQGALAASAETVELSTAVDDDTVLRFNWAAADFGQQEVIAYTLQLDSPTDTSSAYNWGLARNFALGTLVNKYGITGKQLNGYLNEMGFTPGQSNDVVFRIRAELVQYNGSASSVPPLFTNAVGVDITSFAMSLYVPGDYQGWTPATAPKLAPVKGKAGLFEGYVFMEAPGQHYFKYTNAPDWDHTNYGDGGGGSFSTDGAAAGLSVPDGGYYELTANLNTNKWTAVKTTWGIIGDASPGGWDNDTPMNYDPVSQTWKVTLNMKTAGSWKFRANNGWTINFGIDNDGKLFYADNPFFGSIPLNNLTVAADGSYTITLDLHIPGEYTYTAVKN